jgi:hypothetical protein
MQALRALRPLRDPRHWQFIRDELRELAWLLSITVVLSAGGVGLGVILALIAEGQ